MMRNGGAIIDGRYVKAASGLSVCRIDCCTFIVEIDGRVALFDPWINDPAKFAPLWGSYHEEPLVVKALPQPDILLISQNAPDHCDMKAISQLSGEMDVIAPGDAAPQLKKLGLWVRIMKPGESDTIRGIKVTAVPSEHPGVLKQNGYFLEGQKAKVFVLADPAFTPDLLTAIDALPKPVDAVLVSSTGFTLRHFGQILMTPEEAAKVVARARARHAFATRTLMHEGVWGLLGRVLVKSFIKPQESFERFSDELRRLSPGTEIHKLERGQGCVSA